MISYKRLFNVSLTVKLFKFYKFVALIAKKIPTETGA